MKLSKRWITASVAVLVLALLGVGAWLRVTAGAEPADAYASPYDDDAETSAADQFASDLAVVVEGAEVVQDTLVMSVSAAGEAAAWRQTTVRSQVPGQIRALRVTENRAVAGGTVLVEIDPTEYELALEEARARLREAEGRYREITLGDDRIDDAQVRSERDAAARARSGLDVARVAACTVSRSSPGVTCWPGTTRIFAMLPANGASTRVRARLISPRRTAPTA